MAKPTSYPDWTDGNPLKQVEPGAGKKTLGWTAGEKPPFQYFNWLFYILGLWTRYFDETIEAVNAYTAIYSAIIADPIRGIGTHPNTSVGFQAAIDDSTVGDKILILDDIPMTAQVQATRNDMMIEMHPRVDLSKSGAANGLRISAIGVRVKGGRMSGFSAGGDIAILIDAGSDYTMVSEMRFANCDTEISDLNGKGELFANISE